MPINTFNVSNITHYSTLLIDVEFVDPSIYNYLINFEYIVYNHKSKSVISRVLDSIQTRTSQFTRKENILHKYLKQVGVDISDSLTMANLTLDQILLYKGTTFEKIYLSIAVIHDVDDAFYTDIQTLFDNKAMEILNDWPAT